MAAVITWGNLYLVGQSEDSLTNASDIALFGQNTVPQLVYDNTSLQTDATATYYSSATIVQQMLLASQVEVGMLSEPLASATIAAASNNGLDLEIVYDLQSGYGDNGYPQAAIFVKETSDVELVLETVDTYVSNGFEDFSTYLETIGTETLLIPSVDLTVNSLERQNIRYENASEVSQEIETFLALFNIEFSQDMLLE